MKLRKNWFDFLFNKPAGGAWRRLIVSFAAMGMLYIFVYSFISLSKNSVNGYLMQGGVFLALPGIWILLQLAAALSFRFKLRERLSRDKKWVRTAEAVLAGIVLVLAALIRIRMVGQMPAAYLQEGRDYYEIALAIREDSVLQFGKGYCDAIASSPVVMGYSYLLAFAFRIFGPGVRAGQYLNVFFSVGTVFLSYKIVRKAGGRAGAIAALILCAFWPSHIMAVGLISGENAFLFLSLFCIWIFLSLIMDYDGDTPDGMQAVFLYLFLGALLAATAAVNAVSVLLLLAMLIFLLPLQMKLPAKPKNDIPLMVRFLKRGWMRCILILVPYVIVAGVISSNIELSIDRDVPFTKIAFGSSLWEEAEGFFTEETATKKPRYFAERYIKLIDNDDQEISKCVELLESQEDFTKEQKEPYDKASSLNQIFYVITAFFSLLCFFFLLYQESNPVFMLILLFVGINGALFLTGEGDGFHVMLPHIFILLGSMTVWYIFREGYGEAEKAVVEKELLLKEEELEKYQLQIIEQEEEKLAELRKEAYANVFDMKKALQEGHVIMTVSKAYENDADDAEDNLADDRSGPPAEESAEKAIEKSVRESAGEAQQEENKKAKDDFDWNFTEEELNSLVDKNWAAVRELVHRKNQEEQNQEEVMPL